MTFPSRTSAAVIPRSSTSAARSAGLPYETVDLEGLRKRTDDIAEQVAKIQEEGGYDAALMLLTDIIVEGSDFVAAGDTDFIADAFEISFENGPVWMPGVLSRKKQVAAKLIDYAG